MAFVRKKVTTYKWPVPIFSPADGGGFTKETIDLEFLRISRSELENMKDNVQLLKKVIKGWSGYTDEDDKAIPFSVSALEELMEDTAFVPGAAKAYWDSMNGAAQAGN
jgi:hypothetical protein